MRYLLGLVTGLLVSLAAVAVLVMMRHIRVPGLLSPQYEGMWLIPILLAAGAVTGLLLAAGPRFRRGALATAVLLGVVPLSVLEAGLWQERAAVAAQERQIERWTAEGRAAAMAAFGPQAETFAASRPLCPGNQAQFLTLVAGGGRRTWYWYDGAAGRIVAAVTEAQLQERMQEWLPAGARLSATGDEPGVVWFTYARGDKILSSAILLHEPCLLGVTSVGTMADPLFLPLMAPVLEDERQRWVQEREALRQAAVAEALRAFGDGAAQARASLPGLPPASAVTRVEGGGRQVWYWYDGSQIGLTVSADRMQQEIASLLPEGLRLVSLLPGGPVYEVAFRYNKAGAERVGRVSLRADAEGIELFDVFLFEPEVQTLPVRVHLKRGS